MTRLLDRLKNEPVFIFSVAEATIALLVALEVLTPGVGGAAGTLLAVLGGGAVRQTVTPVRKLLGGVTDAVTGQ